MDTCPIGQKFGRLTVVKLQKIDKSKGSYKYYYLCLCDCGKYKTVRQDCLKTGSIRSCGCLHSEVARETQFKNKLTHGKSKSKIYKIWCGMLARCYNKNDHHYSSYGGRKITVSNDWHKFENFYRDMGDASEGMTLDRIKNNESYSKENCQWASKKQQANNRRTSRLITFDGTTQTLSQWADSYGIKMHTLHSRINLYGWKIKDALTLPVKNSKTNVVFAEIQKFLLEQAIVSAGQATGSTSSLRTRVITQVDDGHASFASNDMSLYI